MDVKNTLGAIEGPLPIDENPWVEDVSASGQCMMLTFWHMVKIVNYEFVEANPKHHYPATIKIIESCL